MLTRSSLIYVFGVMTCDEYYKTHPIPSFGDRCHHHEIEASTARAVALLGSSTTLFGVINLFVTGWTIKRFGVKTALLVSIFWPAVRLLVQNVGVMTGAGLGIVIVQCSQIITVVGGPAGYLLALNSFATEIVKPSERTAMLGRLQGCAMFGTSIGFLSGGLLSDKFGILAPFRVAFVLFLLSTLYGMFCLPTVGYNKDIEAKASKSLSAFFAPLKMFAPQKYFLKDGKGITTEYGVLLLGSGVFLGVLATGYQSTLLQLYSTDIFDFGTSANGWLIFLNTSIRGAFLTLAFPIIIKKGRRMLARREHNVEHLKPPKVSEIPSLPVTPTEFAPAPSMEPEQEPVEPPKAADHKEGFGFDLMYTKYSILADGLLTFPATFTNQGWQMYLVAAILPLAAGTASASKGTILQMCNDANASDEEMAGKRADALSAISLVEMLARLSTSKSSQDCE